MSYYLYEKHELEIKLGPLISVKNVMATYGHLRPLTGGLQPKIEGTSYMWLVK